MRNQTQSIDLYALIDLLKVENCVLQVMHPIQASGSQPPSVKTEDFKFSKDIIRIGASDKCDLIIDDPTVSRVHCEIRKMPQGYLLVDHDSRIKNKIKKIQLKSFLCYIIKAPIKLCAFK